MAKLWEEATQGRKSQSVRGASEQSMCVQFLLSEALFCPKKGSYTVQGALGEAGECVLG